MLTQKLNDFATDEEGWVTPFSLMFIAGMLTVLGITVEYAYIVQTKNKLQNATDAVALAAVQALPDEEKALDNGLELSDLYFHDGGKTVGSNDIDFGTWDAANHEFTESAVNVNAIRVTATLSSERGNALKTVVTGLSGIQSYTVKSQSIVYRNFSGKIPGTHCTNGGFFSDSKVKFGSNNDYTGDFCIYGAEKVEMKNSNSFGSSVRVGTDTGGQIEGKNNSDLQDSQIFEKALTLNLVSNIDSVIDNMQKGDLSGIGEFADYTVREIDEFGKHDTLISNSLYIIKGKADLSKQKGINDVAIVAGDDITVGSNTDLDNIILASEGKIEIGSGAAFGTSSYCNGGRYENYLFAKDDIEFGSNTLLRAIQMASKDKITLNSNITGVADVHAEANGYIEYNSNTDFSSCGTPLSSDFDEAPAKENIGSDSDTANVTASYGLVM